MRQPFFGVSAVGYRLEGGFNGPGEPENQWSAWERAGRVPRTAGASGLWSEPDRFFERAASFGAAAIALSVEWARIEPAPGQIDDAAMARYASIFASAAASGLTPVAVLHDDAHPGWLGEEFWLTPGSPDRFAHHVGGVAGRLASCCRHWVTMRQPNLCALAGWVDGRNPPRRVGALSDAWAVVDNFLAAHILAYRAIHEVQRDAEVLLGIRASPSYDWSGLMVDLLCAPGLGVGRDDLDEWIGARRRDRAASYPARDLRDLAWCRLAAATAPFGERRHGLGRVRRGAPRRAVDLVYEPGTQPGAPGIASNGAGLSPERRYALDALLVVWRSPPWEMTPSRAVEGAYAAACPDPEALAAWCRGQTGAIPALPIWVEDGFAPRRGEARDDPWDRRSYVRAQLAALADVPVAWYLERSFGSVDPTSPGGGDVGRPADSRNAAPSATPATDGTGAKSAGIA